jgi:hypothetical protein
VIVASWRGMLYGVQPQDPTTINLIAVGLTAATLVACSLPAVKAASVDPLVAPAGLAANAD